MNGRTRKKNLNSYEEMVQEDILREIWEKDKKTTLQVLKAGQNHKIHKISIT